MSPHNAGYEILKHEKCCAFQILFLKSSISVVGVVKLQINTINSVNTQSCYFFCGFFNMCVYFLLKSVFKLMKIYGAASLEKSNVCAYFMRKGECVHC